MQLELSEVALQRQLKERIFYPEEMIRANGLTEKHEFALRRLEKKPYRKKLDLTCYKDPEIARHIIRYLSGEIKSEIINSESFYKHRLIDTEKLKQDKETHELSYGEFLRYLEKKIESLKALENKNLNTLGFYNSLYRYCLVEDAAGDYFKLNIWELSWFNLSPDRNPITSKIKVLKFSANLPEENAYHLKLYVDFLLRYRTNSASHIRTICFCIEKIMLCVNKSLNEYDRHDVEKVLGKMQEKKLKRNTIYNYLMMFDEFEQFLMTKELVEKNPFKGARENYQMGEAYRYKSTAPDIYVVNQIFAVLDKFKEEQYVLFFLLLYCVGMRRSEAGGLKKNCLEKRGENCFVKMYSFKMKKEVTNQIPAALYDMLADYIKRLPEDNEYLFPSSKLKGRPMSTNVLSEKVKEELLRLNVKNPDGTPYRFTSHSFRHLMGVRMRENRIPLPFIKEQLHHQSANMTMAYLEYLDKAKIKKMDSFINNQGERLSVSSEFGLTDEEAYAEFVRKSINEQILPNGICARPVKLGSCPHGNSCLDCPEFRTDISCLPVHRDQLRRVEEYLRIAVENGWEPQIASQEKTRKALLKIIDALEKMEKEYA